MSGNSVALDTNVAVRLLNDEPGIVLFLNTFSDLLLPVPVIGELRYGALNSSRTAENLAKLTTVLTRCKPIEADLATAETYAALRFELKKQGTPIPENDLWIAAICVQHSLPIATFDHHFSNVNGIQIRRP